METSQALRRALTDMMAAIAEGRTEDPPLTERIAHLEELRQELGGDAPPMLRHLLEKRSYQKALDFLEGRYEEDEPDGQSSPT